MRARVWPHAGQSKLPLAWPWASCGSANLAAAPAIGEPRAPLLLLSSAATTAITLAYTRVGSALLLGVVTSMSRPPGSSASLSDQPRGDHRSAHGHARSRGIPHLRLSRTATTVSPPFTAPLPHLNGVVHARSLGCLSS
jgi:hypothetical protein